MLLHDFIINNATVKQVTLSVTDMDKINIISSQAVLETSFFTTETRSKSFLPLVNSLVKNWLFKTAPVQLIHTKDFPLVDMTLHDSPLLF